MKKMIFSAIAALVLLNGCNSPVDDTGMIVMKSGTSNFTRNYDKICLDEVVYISSYRRMAVWINPETLTASNCSVKNGRLVIEGKK